MALYAIGDVQGCYDALLRLLERLDFDPSRDQLWFTGDLVNRGPQSLEVLRYVKQLGARAITVLGNHDLHLLALAHGLGRAQPDDTLAPILAAPDRDDLLTWLRHRPLVHHDATRGVALVHAGIPPQWDLATLRACAGEIEAALTDPDYTAFLAHMYGNDPRHWSDDLHGWDRLRFAVNCLTRLRYCEVDGRLCLNAKGAPGTQPAGCMPWFVAPARRWQGTRIVFGHWSTLGLYVDDDVVALDTGCLWGGSLSAYGVDTGQVTAVPCSTTLPPGGD